MGTKFNKIKPIKELETVIATLGDLYSEFESGRPNKVETLCPFCASKIHKNSFSYKNSIYCECKECNSLYLSPRLTKDELHKYYEFMHERFHFDIPESQRKIRINNIMAPRWKLLVDKLIPYVAKFPVERYMEIGPGVGYFTEVAQANNCAVKYILVEPDRHCHESLSKLKESTVLYDCLFEDCDPIDCGNIDIIFINSVIEHPFSIDSFFEKLSVLIKDDGVIVLTDMCADGLDIKLLKGDAPNINAYSILQVGSIKGIELLCRRHGLEVQETISTGLMDMDILYEYSKTIQHNHPLKGFESILAKDEVREDIQQVLRRHFLTGYNSYIIKKV
jgi:2-polyprenyl-3-methyl-5-hydroxy-6-metoxy-1,4-benzoquinol methylase